MVHLVVDDLVLQGGPFSLTYFVMTLLMMQGEIVGLLVHFTGNFVKELARLSRQIPS